MEKDINTVISQTHNRPEILILKNLMTNEVFARRVLPFLKPDYFTASSERLVFQGISQFIVKYNNLPTFEAMVMEAKATKNVSEGELKEAIQTLKTIYSLRKEKSDMTWLTEQAEKFCRDQAIYNAVSSSIEIIRGESKKKDRGAIPELLSAALAISFDPSIGQDYVADAEHRWEFYQRRDIKVPFRLKTLNKITNGGLTPKTLNVILGGIYVGKTLTMCDMSAQFLMNGKNVLYISLEMSEDEIFKRIDANLIDVDMDDISLLPKDVFLKKIHGNVEVKTKGRLLTKEFPTSEASVVHFDALLRDLTIKQNFKPDVVVVDYLNLCSSSRIRMGAAVNSYTYIKAIAEELRGLAVRHNVVLLSATQLNRTGFEDSDVSMTHTSESFGLPATVDFFLAIMTNETLERLGQYKVKQLKNRYRDANKDRNFLIGVQKPRMRLFDLSASAQKTLTNTGSGIGEEEIENLSIDIFPAIGANTSQLKGLKV